MIITSCTTSIKIASALPTLMLHLVVLCIVNLSLRVLFFMCGDTLVGIQLLFVLLLIDIPSFFTQ